MNKLMNKPWFESKTIWLAIIQAIGGIIAIFVIQYPSIGALLITKSVIDILLRLLTELPIK